jgi:glycosyltransferase involved in cell wall biosynthesis
MTRIVCFCDYYDRQSVGGAEVVAREVYKRLMKHDDVKATLVGGLPTVSSVAVDQDSGWPRHVAAPGRDLTGWLGSQAMYSPALRSVADNEIRSLEPDVVHVNGLHFHSTAVGYRASRRHGLALVATAHLADVAALSGVARAGATVLDRTLAGRVARAADQLVAVSDSVKDHMLHLGVEPARISVALNGVDRTRFHSRGRVEPAAWLRAILVGRMVHNKGTAQALEAVARARSAGRDIRLTVVGDGPLAIWARERAAAPDLAGAVEFTGRVSDVDRWLRDADVLLRPSFTEGLPLAVLESLSCGTPVVCSAVSGTLEAVTDGENGIVVPIGDVQALSDGLIRLHEDRRELGRMSSAAEQSARRFSWDVSADVHLAALRKAAETGGRRRARRFVQARRHGHEG